MRLNIFSCVVSHLCVFFGKMFIKYLCLLFIIISFLFLLRYYMHILDNKTSWSIICKSSPNQQVVFFALLMISFCCVEAFCLMQSHLFTFPCFISLSRRQIKKHIFKTMSKSILARFPLGVLWFQVSYSGLLQMLSWWVCTVWVI